MKMVVRTEYTAEIGIVVSVRFDVPDAFQSYDMDEAAMGLIEDDAVRRLVAVIDRGLSAAEVGKSAPKDPVIVVERVHSGDVRKRVLRVREP